MVSVTLVRGLLTRRSKNDASDSAGLYGGVKPATGWSAYSQAAWAAKDLLGIILVDRGGVVVRSQPQDGILQGRICVRVYPDTLGTWLLEVIEDMAAQSQ